MAVKRTNIFCYRSTATLLHKVPPLVKIFFLIIFCIAVFWNSGIQSAEKLFCNKNLIHLGICFFICLILFCLSGFHLSTLAAMKFVFVIGIFVTLFSSLIFEGTKLKFSFDGMWQGLFYTFRFFISSLAAQCIFETTSSLKITEAFESLEKIIPGAKKINFALTLSLAVNFIPEIFETWNRIEKAGEARSDKNKNLIKQVKILISKFEALFSIMLNRAEEKRRAVINRM